ncbi:MAG: pyridoxamine 5'-phosphate oxidase family protein [Chloroflexota bacterium]
MDTIYHAGELDVQAHAGGLDMAARLAGGVRPYLFDYVIRALPEQTFLVASVADVDGNAWALPMVGAVGFVTAKDRNTIHISPDHMLDAPSIPSLVPGAMIGLLGIVLENRIRIRINGVIEAVNDDGLTVNVHQAYGNCPKYIQIRQVVASHTETPTLGRIFNTLAPEHHKWIARVDTFFVATGHPTSGMDASHRGGNPGFVKVLDDQTLLWPDYAGNMMFNTLGNITANPRTGLLFIDFEHDRVLQLAGRAVVHHDDARQADFAGAQRLVSFEISEGRVVSGGLGRRWALTSRSHYNP